MDKLFQVLGYLKERLAEKTTQRAMFGLAALAGYNISPENANNVLIILGLAAGLVEILRKG